MKTTLLIEGVAVLMMALLSGCATLHGATTEKIGNRHVEYALAKRGTGTVVFENGLGGTINWWALVGHSLGGLYMQLFARRYPNEVSALILLDSTHPAQFKGKGAPENWPTWFRLAYGVATSSVEKQEMNAINAIGESVLSLPSFTGKPVIVLSALQPMKEKSELADDANAKRKDIAQLYPGSKQIWVESGRYPAGEA